MIQKYQILKCWVLFLFVVSALTAQEAQEIFKIEIPKEEFSETQHSLTIDATVIPYKAVAGSLHIKDEASGKVKANLFYIAYTKITEDQTARPITFCFNGGPGSSSVWLHLGALGPKRVVIPEDHCVGPPYTLEDNIYSLLATSDLVFIDPVSTGYSRVVPGEEAKQFHGVEADIKSMAEFIRLYITRNNRWLSPKFIAGESYGTTRAAGLAGYLHDEYGIYLNGLILVSSILNFQTLTDYQRGNDLPYLMFLPSFTASAWYHKKLPQDLQKDLSKALKEAEDFSSGEYNYGLFLGDQLPKEQREKLVKQLARYSGLSPEYIDRANLRISSLNFSKELLRSEKETIGRFDSRMKGMDYDSCGQHFEYDPSLDAVFGAFSAAFNHYVRVDLKWKGDDAYNVMANVQPWDYGKATNQYLNVAETLRETMCKNQSLRVFVASGYFDLATPYFGSQYTFDHMGLIAERKKDIVIEHYEGGHMMFITLSVLQKMSRDIKAFVSASCQLSLSR